MNERTEAPRNSGEPATHADGIAQVIAAREQDIGGFKVRRLIPVRGRRTIGPWIFFDHMGPVDLAPGTGLDVLPHPHINLATVTYLFDGAIRHRDSLGNDQMIEPGAINLMVAGSGIVHSEREPAELRQMARRVHGLQLWLALPEAVEEMPPAFDHYPARDIPEADVGGIPVRVMMGSAYGQNSPVRTFMQTLYFEARLTTGQRLRLPDHIAERAVYVTDGAISVGGEAVPAYTMAVLQPGAATELIAEADSLIAVIGGEPMPPRHIWWNFVSSRRERIEQAKKDWAERRFPLVPGDEEEFVPLPDY